MTTRITDPAIDLDLVHRLDAAAIDFLTRLRDGAGLHEPSYRALQAVLEDCASAWSASDTIPKRALPTLTQIVADTEGAAGCYDREVHDRILGAADELGNLVLEIASS